MCVSLFVKFVLLMERLSTIDRLPHTELKHTLRSFTVDARALSSLSLSLVNTVKGMNDLFGGKYLARLRLVLVASSQQPAKESL